LIPILNGCIALFVTRRTLETSGDTDLHQNAIMLFSVYELNVNCKDER
jgi:hypothetical protein